MNALIIGAGPAGLSLAHLLVRNGVDVTVVEREPDFERTFRGEGLMPSGVDALYEMGLGDFLAEVPSRPLEAWEVFIDGTLLFDVPEPMEELGDRGVHVVSQPHFLRGLVDRLSGSPHFTFLSGAAMHDLMRDGNRVVGVVLREDGASRELSADYVFGCDGRGSLVRTKAGLELNLLAEHYDVLWFKMPAPDALRDGCRMQMMVADGRAGACYTSWDGRLQFALTIPKGARRAQREDWFDELQAVAPRNLAAHFATVRDQIEGPVRLNVLVGRCREWSAPGVMVLGDAAHPMAPIRAQGINVALRDAIVAANHFAPLLRDGAPPEELDAAAKRVQAEREPEIKRSQTLQHRDTRGLNSRAAPLLIGLAKILGPRMGKYAWAKRAWLDQQKDLRFGSVDVRLTV